MLRQFFSRVPTLLLVGIGIGLMSLFALGPVVSNTAVAEVDSSRIEEIELGTISLAGLEDLFDSLDGSWRGRGQVTTGFGSGREETKTLRSRLRFDRPWRRDARWTWEEELERIEDRVTFLENQAYFVRRDGMYLGGDTPHLRVDLVAAGAQAVIFEYSWSNPPNRSYRREIKIQRNRFRGFDLMEKLYLRGQLLEVKQMTYE
ncbi:MAG: hypothetical protein KDD43_16130 [Bdellovibrionales bacterium]|nr:hypothetical protein [Bdellovibrionales bacterium]